MSTDSEPRIRQENGVNIETVVFMDPKTGMYWMGQSTVGGRHHWTPAIEEADAIEIFDLDDAMREILGVIRDVRVIRID